MLLNRKVQEETRRMDNICLTTKRLIFNRDGQALVEYTLVVLLVTFVFWLGIRDTDFGQGLQTAWTGVGGSISPTTDNGSSGGSGSSSGGASGAGGSGGGSSSGSGSSSDGAAGGSTGGGSSGGTGGGSMGGSGSSSGGSGGSSGGSAGGGSREFRRRIR